MFTGALLCSDHMRSVRDNQICDDGVPGAILGPYPRKKTQKKKTKKTINVWNWKTEMWM